MHTQLQIVIIGPHHGISKIPCMIGKNIISDSKPERTQILDKENCCRPCIPFPKNMNLPKSRNKSGKMPYYFRHGKPFIAVGFLLRKIIFQRRSKFCRTAIDHGISIKYPFFLRNIIVSDLTGMCVDTFEQSPVNREILCRRKNKSVFRKQHCYPHRDKICLLRPVLPNFRVLLIICLDQRLRLIQRNIAFNIFPCCFFQIIGRHQTIHRLKSDRRMPGISTFPPLRLCFS